MPSNQVGTGSSVADHVLTWIFSVFLLAGWLPVQLGWGPDPATAAHRENRSLHSWPKAIGSTAWTNWIHQLELALQDRLAWRPQLISAHHRLLLAMGRSPRPDVFVGTDGTLFYDELRRRGYLPTKGYGATFAFPESQLRLIARVLEERRHWLEQHGIGYRVVLIPDKQSVYPDRLPLKLAREAQPSSVAGQVVAALRQWTRVDALDLTPALRAARRDGELYYRYDTHWTPLGVAVGAVAISEWLREQWPHLPALPRSWSWGHPVRPPYLDLARLLGLEAWFDETATSVSIEEWPAARIVRSGTGTDPIEFETGQPDRPSVWVLHDSFTGLLAHHLAPLFDRSLFQWHTRAAFHPAEILAWRPTLVMEIVVERHANLWRGNHPTVTAASEQTAFETSDRRLAFVTSPPLLAVGETQAEPSPEGWRVQAGPDGATLRVAGLRLEPSADAILRLSFDSSSCLDVELSWRRYRRPVRLRAQLDAGRAEWWVRLSPPADDGPYQLRVTGAATFTLHEPEARAVPMWGTDHAGGPPFSVVP